MTDFVVTITDPAQLAGITWAREQFNASLPPPPPDTLDTMEGGMEAPMMPMPMVNAVPPIETDQEYVQHVMEQAAVSYADQQLRAQYQDAYETEVLTRSGGRHA
jgi:hypothetical protein